METRRPIPSFLLSPAVFAALLALLFLLGLDTGFQYLVFAWFVGSLGSTLAFASAKPTAPSGPSSWPLLAPPLVLAVFVASGLLPDHGILTRSWEPETFSRARLGAFLLSCVLVAWIAYAVRTRIGAAVAGIGARRDFYDAQVREIEQKLQALLNAIPDRMFRLSATGTVLDYRIQNESELFAPPASFLGRKIVDVHPSAQLKAEILGKIAQALDTDQVQSFEYQLPAQSSAAVGFYEARLVKSGPGEVLMMSRDVTRERLAERELSERRIQMVTASRLSLLGEMAGGIAHEINNPLAIIQGRASILRERAEAGPLQNDEVVTAATKIESTVTRISRIVQSLRSFAREATEDITVPTDLSILVESTLELCREKFRNNAIDLRLAPIQPGLVVQCRPSQISQILMNLLNNAYDAVREREGAWIEVSASVSRGPGSSGSVEVAVSDNGPGVPGPLRDRIFEPFFTTKEIGKGTGLGLSFSLGVAQSHGGTLVLDPRSTSTRFVLSLPKLQADQPERST